MTNAIIKDIINLRTVLLLMVKIVGNIKPSLLIVPLLAAMKYFSVFVKGKICLINVKTNRIRRLVLD